MELRPYQTNVKYGVRAAYKAGYRRVLAVMPTGSGKTVLFADIAHESGRRGFTSIVLVHRKELLSQALAKMLEFGAPAGAIHPEHSYDYTASTQVASINTLVKRMHSLHLDPDLIIIDEAHHATAPTYAKILAHYPRARVLGVTATPIRGDGTGLDSVFDAMVVGPQIHELQALGNLVPVRWIMPKSVIDRAKLKVSRGDYDLKEQETEIDKAGVTGDSIRMYKKYSDGLPAIAFCVSVAHAEHVAAMFRDAGYRSESVDGSLSDSERKCRIQGLANGEVQVLTSCDLIGEGLDIPAATTAIILRLTKSTALALQWPGRILRPAPGKSHGIVIDQVGLYSEHSDYLQALVMPVAIEWTLQGDEKKKGKEKQEKGLPVWQCEKCYTVNPMATQVCACGHERVVKGREINHVEGELIELNAESIELLKKAKAKKVAQARTLDELEKVALELGYKRGWARMVYEARADKFMGKK